MVRVIGIVSAKGGVGKTTVTANLGAALASEFGRKVVAVDCNLTTSHLGLYLGVYSPLYTLNNILRNEVSLQQATCEHASGLKVIPASLGINDLYDIDTNNLRKILKNTFSQMDIILLDSSPGLGREALITLQTSEELIFVTTPHIAPIVDITKTRQLATRMHKKPIGIVLNRVKNQRYELKTEEIEQLTNLPVIATIPEDENAIKSTNSKVPLVSMYPNSLGSRAFFKLAADLVGEKYYYKPGLIERIVNIFKRNRANLIN